MTADTDAATSLPIPREIMLEPFSFAAELGSGIAGLYDGPPRTDPFYVLHSHYVPGLSGLTRFDVMFEGLNAKSGQFTLTVHSLSSPQNIVEPVAIATFRLDQVAAGIVRPTVAFDADPAYAYAVVGRTVTPVDATARAVEIICHNDSSRLLADETPVILRTSFGKPAVRAVALMSIGERPPSLAYPLSQPMTQRQMREPVFTEWTEHLPPHETPRPDLVFVLQALRSYGFLNIGARGIGFGPDVATLTPIMAKAGCVLTDGNIGSEEEHTKGQFDFIWSTALCSHTNTTGEVIRIVEKRMACLKPDGMAVHMLDYTTKASNGATFARNDILRMNLAILGRKDVTAQVNFTADADGPAIVPFGLILRHG